MPDPTLDTLTTAQVKAYFGYTLTDKDAQIDIIRPMASAFIKSYCRHDFECISRSNETPEIEALSEFFYLNYRPISLISSLTENGRTLTENTDFYVRKNSGRVEKIKDISSIFTSTAFGGYWDSTPGVIVVNYTGGEVLCQDVIQVFYEIVGIYSGLRVRGYLTNEGVEGVISINTIPDALLNILEFHKHTRI